MEIAQLIAADAAWLADVIHPLLAGACTLTLKLLLPTFRGLLAELSVTEVSAATTDCAKTWLVDAALLVSPG